MKDIKLHAELEPYVLFLNEVTGQTVEDCRELILKWYQPWRFYHNYEHLLDILIKIRASSLDSQSDTEYVLAAIFHDVVYLPWAEENEFASDTLMEEFCKNVNVEVRENVSRLIMCTASRRLPEDQYLRRFWLMDNDVLLKPTIKGLLEYEAKIRKEFQFVSYDVYKKERTKFIKTWVRLNYHELGENIIFKLDMLGSYIEQYVPKIGVYAGSFNPFHKGHLNILEKAEKVFDKVIVAVGKNTDKSMNISSLEQIISSVLYREVVEFNCSLSEYLEQVGEYSDVYLVRGLRNGHDLNYEQNQLWFMNKLTDIDINTAFFVCDEGLEHISSSSLRALSKVNSERALEVYNDLIPIIKY